MSAPLTFESLSIAFFATLAIVSPATQAAPRRRARVAVLCGLMAAGIWLAGRTTMDVRGWLGHGYLVAGYWMPALLAPQDFRGGRFESWLVSTDERFRTLGIRVPAWMLPPLETAYLLCYVLVPAAFVAVWVSGTAADVGRFWTAVLLSGFVCYGSIPWLVSRPPRSLDALRAADTGVRGANVFVLARVSHGLNTFPSGHVAVSIAAALAVLPVSPLAGAMLIAVAAAIAAGAIAGRYHYAADVILGAVIGTGVAIFL